jgi:hypothetical protein
MTQSDKNRLFGALYGQPIDEKEFRRLMEAKRNPCILPRPPADWVINPLKGVRHYNPKDIKHVQPM